MESFTSNEGIEEDIFTFYEDGDIEFNGDLINIRAVKKIVSRCEELQKKLGWGCEKK